MEARPESAETILIVDDDELVRKSAATLMASLGYRVLSAGSGSDALEVLRQDGPIDLLFTDVFMPGGMHGPQLVAAARRLRPELKILFTSGYFEYAEIRHALDPSIEQVSKPYEREALAAILRRTLSGRRRRRRRPTNRSRAVLVMCDARWVRFLSWASPSAFRPP
jgi:DNA-binding NtrC family response regulator